MCSFFAIHLKKYARNSGAKVDDLLKGKTSRSWISKPKGGPASGNMVRERGFFVLTGILRPILRKFCATSIKDFSIFLPHKKNQKYSRAVNVNQYCTEFYFMLPAWPLVTFEWPCSVLQKIYNTYIITSKNYFTSAMLLIYNTSTVILHYILLIRFHWSILKLETFLTVYIVCISTLSLRNKINPAINMSTK